MPRPSEVHQSCVKASERLSCTVLITGAGGVLLRWNEDDAESYTHVVANHRKEAHALLAEQHGQHIVSLLWVWESLASQRLLPISEEKV